MLRWKHWKYDSLVGSWKSFEQCLGVALWQCVGESLLSYLPNRGKITRTNVLKWQIVSSKAECMAADAASGLVFIAESKFISKNRNWWFCNERESELTATFYTAVSSITFKKPSHKMFRRKTALTQTAAAAAVQSPRGPIILRILFVSWPSCQPAKSISPKNKQKSKQNLKKAI